VIRMVKVHKLNYNPQNAKINLPVLGLVFQMVKPRQFEQGLSECEQIAARA
jgi:hypothetical protein